VRYASIKVSRLAQFWPSHCPERIVPLFHKLINHFYTIYSMTLYIFICSYIMRLGVAGVCYDTNESVPITQF